MSREAALAWAAGIIDGEGCISIVHYGPGHALRCTTDRYVLLVKVTMGHRPTVARLAEIFGHGTVQHHVAKSDRVNASYSWIAQSRKAESVLSIIRPFLFTKSEEADVALEFLGLPLSKRGGPKGSKNTPPWLLRRREALYWKLRKLKSRWRFYNQKEKLRKAAKRIEV